jgi:drug/metabolite transporter (DMT)-like permease
MIGTELAGRLFVLGTILGFGLSTALLRAAIVTGTTDTARLLRVSIQTAIVFAGVALGGTVLLFDGSLRGGSIYPVLNGLLSGVAFISFSKGLESVDASTAKPLLTIATVVAVGLSVLFLGDRLTPRTVAGIAFAIGAVYLLTSESDTPD